MTMGQGHGLKTLTLSSPIRFNSVPPASRTVPGIQCVKVLVVQSCPTLCNPMDCSSLGSSIHEILQARILELDCHSLLQGSFPTQGSNLGLLHYRQILYGLSHTGKQLIAFIILIYIKNKINLTYF